MCACTHGIEELAYLSEHVCEGQHGDESLPGFDGQEGESDLYIVAE